MELSIIIPCYRVAQYVAECLESVCGLPPEQVEIVCIDDGSPDGSGEILAGYAARYPHLRVYAHARNQGLSAARNTGLDHARGAYVLFLDSDDMLRATAVLPLLEEAKIQNLDILQAGYERFEDGSGRPLPTPTQANRTGVMTGDACFAEQSAAGTFEPMTVLRLYRRAFLLEHSLRMEEGALFEDELFTAPAFLCARRVQVTDTVLYRYRLRAEGIMDGFRRSADWCAHYLSIARKLRWHCDGLPGTAGSAALRRRAEEIALSIPKNMAAYRLEGEVRQAAMDFLRANRKEIAGFAAGSTAAVIRAQGVLLRASIPIFLALYGVASGNRWLERRDGK